MKIECTAYERIRIIQILADNESPCLFEGMKCREDKCCEQCLWDNIDWRISDNESVSV